MKRSVRRVPLLLLDKAEDVFKLRPIPAAILIDLEGTLTEFGCSASAVIETVKDFDEIARQNGLDLGRIHYVTNADIKDLKTRSPRLAACVHADAWKPFFTPPVEFPLGTVVVGDQYLTDGLLAWRFGFSFGLVRKTGYRPAWPRLQFFVGHVLSRLFFVTAE